MIQISLGRYFSTMGVLPTLVRRIEAMSVVSAKDQKYDYSETFACCGFPC